MQTYLVRDLPDVHLALVDPVADVIVRTSRERSRSLVHEAVDLDPTALDKAAGRQAIDACLEAHADILPAYP